MRKLVILSVALLLFATLAVLFMMPAAKPGKTNPEQSTGAISLPAAAISDDQLTLRLDTRLASPPRSAPRSPATQREITDLLRLPDQQRALLFLSAALSLGILTGLLLRSRSTVHSAHDDHTSKPIPALLNRSVASDDLVAEAVTEHVAHAAALQEEILALRDSIESHEVAQQHNQQRLSDHQVTIEELRHELRHTDELTLALQRSQQQEQLLSGELEERDDTIKNLHEDLDSLREQLAARTSQFEKLDQQHNDILQQHQQSLSDHQITSSELQTKQRENEDLRQTLASAGQQELALSEELAKREQTINNLQSDIDNWREEWAARTTHIEDLDRQIVALTENLQQSRDDETSAQQSITELQRVRETLLAEIEQLTPNVALVESLGHQLEELDERYDIAMADKRALENSLHDAQTLAEQIPKLESQLTAAQEKISDGEAAITVAQEEIDKLQSRYAELQAEKEHGDEQFRQLGSAHSEQSTALDEQLQLLAESQATIDQQQEETRTLQATLDSSRADIETRTADMLELRNFLEQSNLELSRAHQNCADTQAELDRETGAKEELLDQKLQLEEQLAHQGSELITLNDANTELNDSVASLRDDLTQMVNKIHQKNAAIDTLEKALADAESELTKKENAISELANEVETERSTIQDMQIKVDAAEATELRLSNWDNSLQTYKQDLSNKNRLIDELRDELSLATHTGTSLKAQIRNMDEQLETLFDVRTEVADLAQVTARLNRDLLEQNEIIASGKQQNLQHEAKIDDFSQELENLQSERAQWQQNLEQSDLTLKTMQEELEDSYSILSRLEELIVDELSHEQYTHWSGLSDGGSVVDRLAAITSHTAYLRDSLSAALAENETLLSTRDEVLGLQEHIQLLQQAVADHQHDLQQEITARKQHEQNCQNYREIIVSLEAEIAEKSGNITALTHTENATQAQVKTLHEELHFAQAQLQKATVDSVDQQREVTRLKEQITALQITCDEHTELLKTETQSLQTQFEQQHMKLSDRYQTATTQLQSELTKLQRDNNALRQKISQQQDALRNRKPPAEPLPVLTTKYADGKVPDTIPVLGSSTPKKAPGSPATDTTDSVLSTTDIPVLHRKVDQDEA